MGLAQFFSSDYRRAKEGFLAAAERLGLRREFHEIGAKGPAGEALTIDIAFSGSRQPARVVIVSSGLHGVEGFFGSAVQLAWLEQRAPRLLLPADAAVILIHALNPYGFAWRRRWNENNVDLNRNFVSDRSFVTSDPDYAESRRAFERLHAFLNPRSPPCRFEPYTMKAFWTLLTHGYEARSRLPIDRRPSLIAVASMFGLGLAALQRTLPVGQYEHEDSLFFGGFREEETTRFLRQALPTWVGAADTIVHLDFHTGLGPHGKYKLLTDAGDDSGETRWARTVFGGEHVEAWSGATAYQARGLMATDLRQRFADRRYHCLTAEFGTYAAIRVLGALRAEHRAHRYAKPGSPMYEWAKRELTEVFCPSSQAWRNATVEQGLALMEQALQGCCGPADKP